MPGMYGARKGIGMGIDKDLAMLFSRQRISALLEPRER